MKTVLMLAIICFFPYLARADTDVFPANCSVPVSDINGWETVRTSRVEFRLSDEVVAYLGMDVLYATYRNPSDSGEFVQVIGRHVPGIFATQKPKDERLILEVVTTTYDQENREDFFSEIVKKVDLILYLHWRVRENPRTGGDMLDGDVSIWFLASSGECLVAKNEKVKTQFLTENTGDPEKLRNGAGGKPRNVFVGVKYQVGDSYHILKVDRRDLIQLMNERGR